MSLEIGSVCVKTAGRHAGEKVVIVGVEKGKNFATVIGAKLKKKRCNLKHLFPVGKTVNASKEISQKDLAELLKE